MKLRPLPTAAATLAAVTLFALTGCSGGSSTGTAASPGSAAAPTTQAASSPAPEPSSSPPQPSPTPSPSPPPSPSPTAGFQPQLILEPDGLGFLVGPASIRHLTFADTSADAIRTALAHVLGTLKTQPLPECGQGARTSLSRDGFSVLLSGTKFVGWTDQGSKGITLTTAIGLGIGSTLAQVKQAEGAVTLDNATLGPEFFKENGISGFLTGLKDTSKVTAVYAGETCFFR